MEPAPRFEWERIMPRNDWERLIRALPVTSPLFRHNHCEGGRCWRPNGSQLHAKTIKAGAYALATFAKPDGTDAHPGIGGPRRADPEHEVRGMMLATCQAKVTVIAVLKHLETVGLIAAFRRGGSLGLPRSFATSYCLTSPPLETLVDPGRGGDVYDFFRRHDSAGG